MLACHGPGYQVRGQVFVLRRQLFVFLPFSTVELRCVFLVQPAGAGMGGRYRGNLKKFCRRFYFHNYQHTISSLSRKYAQYNITILIMHSYPDALKLISALISRVHKY